MAYSANRCYFQWDIYNPFVAWKHLEATFYYGSPTATQWKVTLKPMDRGINYWKFSFTLKFDGWLDHRDDIVADNVLVFINLKNDLITSKEVPNYHFCRLNRFRYDFQEKVVMHPQTEPHHLVIRIELSLPCGARTNEEQNDVEHLRHLSEVMEFLLSNPRYPNMILWSANPLFCLHVHSYIINARWCNFFRRHPAVYSVQTNISSNLLSDILKYMYSGALDTHWPNWTNADYTTELFQVMDWYKLYHLYRVLVKSDLQQQRVTRHPGVVESHLFPLDVVVDRPINNASHTWNFNPNPEYEFVFQIRVWNEAGNWLSYSLQSKCPSRVYAQVNLELEKEVEGNALGVFHFHGRDCTIDPDETVESGPVLFLGCPETFGDSDGTEIKHSIRCFLNVFDGTKVEHVQSVGDDTLEDVSERLGVLSDHMHQMKEQRWDADLRILSSPRFPGEDEMVELIHKGIFAARLPRWWNGLLTLQHESGIPDIERSTLSRDSLPIVLKHMYTGKVSHIPKRLLDEIEKFALVTEFLSFYNLVASISRRMNR